MTPEMPKIDAEWYALSTKPRHEHQAASSLETLGVQTLCPRLMRRKIVRRKWRDVLSPLFPGYIFARFDPNASFRAVSYARGVRKIVSFGNTPVIVDEDIITGIKARMVEGYVMVTPTSLSPGQTVRIQSGPLEGQEAIFEREMSDHQRVVLMLNAIAARWRVIVPLDQVANL